MGVVLGQCHDWKLNMCNFAIVKSPILADCSAQCLWDLLLHLDYVAWDEEGDVSDRNATASVRRQNTSRFGVSHGKREDDNLESRSALKEGFSCCIPPTER